MHAFAQDIRQALRLLRRAPLASAVVILTLALGIGANAAVFSVVRATFLGRLPYGNAERLVSVWSDNLTRGWPQFGTSPADFLDWQAETRTLSSVSAYWTGQGNLTGGDRPERVRFATVSPNMFQTLGTEPRLGRGFRPEEEEPGRKGVVMLSDGFWRRTLGGRADVIGKTVSLDGEQLTVIGVMPAGFAFPTTSEDFWVPLEAPDRLARGARYLTVIAAIGPGHSYDEAATELAGIGTRLSQAYPRTNTNWTVSLEPFRTTLVSGQGSIILIAWAAVSLVLLIAAANVANLLLARALKRRRELAVRSALGARHGRLVRQLLTESLVLALAGGALGLLFAWAGLGWIAQLAPGGLPGAEHLRLDPLVVTYAALTMLVTGVVFGTFPAIRSVRTNLEASLRAGDRADVASGSRRLRDLLVVTELGLAAMVLVGAGLTIRSLGWLLHEDPGFQTARRFTLSVAPPRSQFPERLAAVQYFDQALAAAAAVPGVRRVGAVSILPVPGGTWWTTSFFPEGREFAPNEEPAAAERVVQGDFFGTIGIPLLAGRTFLPSDRAEAEPVVVVDQTVAERFWPGEDPLGQRLSIERTGRGGVARRWYRIVGVVGAVRNVSLAAAPAPSLYFNLAQAQSGHFRDWQMAIVAEADIDLATAAAGVRRAVEAAGPGIPVYRERTLEEQLATNVATQRFAMGLLTGFGLLALGLAAIGVYGLLATVVSERTREIGLRLALGAAPDRVLRQVLREGLTRAALGLTLGLGAAALGSRLLSSLLYGVASTDPVTYFAIATVLLVVTGVAAAVPAWRAARVDPMVALRSE